MYTDCGNCFDLVDEKYSSVEGLDSVNFMVCKSFKFWYLSSGNTICVVFLTWHQPIQPCVCTYEILVVGTMEVMMYCKNILN